MTNMWSNSGMNKSVNKRNGKKEIIGKIWKEGTK